MLVVVMGVQAGILGETVLPGGGTKGPYRLAHNFIIVESDSVFIDGRLISRDDYELEHAGWLTFRSPVPETSSIRVAYRYLPLNLPHPYSLNPQPESARPEIEPISRLSARGSKVVGVELGAGGLDLAQSLNLMVSGDLAGVEIQAQLSDQETAIPPEGTTQKLSQLDRVAIELSHPNFSAQLGDCGLRVDLGRFGSIFEQLEGGMGEMVFDRIDLNLGILRTPGQPAHRGFLGQLGCQGPYPLTGPGGPGLVPGSERVWLDGMPMRRGWDEDYIIDYETGDLTFTNARLITDRSRIEVDFQLAAQPYERLTYNLGGGYQLGDIRVEVQGYEEGDDPGRPLEYQLSPEDRAYLAEIGDDTGAAWLPGERWVGPGRGEYVREADHFSYVGPGEGEYQVRFTRVADGEYIYDPSLPGFRWVGPGAGSYIPKIRVELPERSRVAFARLGYQPERGVGITLDGLFTQHDANLLSLTGDLDNQGAGYGLDLSYEHPMFRLGYSREQRAADLYLPGRDRPLDFYHRWGAEPDSGFTTDELSMTISPISGLSLSGELGWLTERLSRYQVSLGYLELLSYVLEEVDLERRQRLSLWAPANYRVRPRIRLREELGGVERYRGYGLDLGFKPRDRLSLELSYDQSRTLQPDSLTREWLGVSEDRLYQASVATDWKGLEIMGRIGYRARQPLEIPVTGYKDRFADIRASYRHPRGLGWDLEFHRTRGSVRGYSVEYRWVGPGRGEYSQDPESGRFYPDPGGSYERLIRPDFDPIPSQDSRLNTGLRIAGGEGAQLSGRLGLHQKSSQNSILSQAATVDLMLSILPYDPRISWELGASGDMTEDRLLPIPSSSLAHRASLSTRFRPLQPLQLLLRSRICEQQRFEGSELEHQEEGYELSLEPTLLIPVELSPIFGYAGSWVSKPLNYPELGQFPLNELKLGLGLNFGVAQARIHGRLDRVRRQSSASFWPYELSLSRPLGTTTTWGLGAERFLSRELTLSLDYSGELRPDRRLDHRFSSYLRAYF